MSKHSAYDSNLHVSETKSQMVPNRKNPQNSNESRILDPNPLFGDPGPMQNKLAQPNGRILIPSSSRHHNIKSSVSPENAVASSVGSGSGSVSPRLLVVEKLLKMMHHLLVSMLQIYNYIQSQ